MSLYKRKLGVKSDVVVVIPFYNGRWCIERALQSVALQTILPNEVIVVDDGSRKDEYLFLKKIQPLYKFKLLTKENGGQGSARNLGVKNSNTRYICFLDQDDTFYPSHIEDLLKITPKNDLRFGFAYADLDFADGNGHYLQYGVVKNASQHPKTSLYEMISTDMHVLPSASLISRVAFNSVGGFDEQFTGYEDDDLFLRLFWKGFTNYFLDKSVALWHINDESTSYSIKMSRSRLKYFKKLILNFPDNPKRGIYVFRDCIFPRFKKIILHDVINAFICDDENKEEKRAIFIEFSKISAQDLYLPIERRASLWAINFFIKLRIFTTLIKFLHRSSMIRNLLK